MKARHTTRIVGLLAVALLALGAVPAQAATLVANLSNMQGWTPASSHCGGGTSTATGALTSGPATPPLGSGSYSFATGADGDSFAQIGHAGFDLTRLDALTALSYSTYVGASAGDQAPYLILTLDSSGDTTADDRIFFEPEYQNGYTTSVPTQAALVSGAWQTWNALSGGWWSLSTPGVGPGFDVKTIAHYLTVHPDARILNASSPGVRLVAGCGAPVWSSFSGATDNLTIKVGAAETVFDFERTFSPVTVAPAYADKAEQSYTRPDLLTTGGASSNATANKTTGVVQVTTAANDTMPAGTTTLSYAGNLGAADSTASARVVHSVPVGGAGTFHVTVTLAIDPSTAASASPGYPSVAGLRESVSSVAAIGGFTFAATGAGSSDQRTLVSSYGGASPATVVLQGDVVASGAGSIRVDAGLVAASTARGYGSTSAAGKATVQSIVITLA